MTTASTATTTPEPAAPKQAHKSATDHLQDALEDLDKARQEAGDEASTRIDSARDRICEARSDLSERGEERLQDWRGQLGSAADDVLCELGRWAISAQRSPEALTELSKEITKRESALSA